MGKGRWIVLLILLLAPAPFAQFVHAEESAFGQQNITKKTHPIPFRSEADKSMTGLGVRVVAILAVMLLLAFGVVYAIKRWLPNIYIHRAGGKDIVQVQETRRITPRLTLLVLDFEGSRILVAQSGDRTVTLAQKPIDGQATISPRTNDSPDI